MPRVLFSDPDNYVFAMSHAPPKARVWKEMLLAGEVDPALGELAGRILGTMHQATANSPGFAEQFGDATVFVQLRVDPFYRRIQDRCPDVAAAIDPLIEQALTVGEALCHGDFSPKNLLVHQGAFTLVDYETAYFGDPTFDLGFFLSHVLLKAVKHESRREDFFDLTRAFWQGYAAAATWKPLADLQRRGIGHLAGCLLARIDGTSPVDYLPEERQRDMIRQLARRLLATPPDSWDNVLW